MKWLGDEMRERERDKSEVRTCLKVLYHVFFYVVVDVVALKY